MAKHMRAEDLRTKVFFQSRGMVDDGFGNMVPGGEFETQFHLPDGTWANLKPLRGSETVMASRLEGRQPYIITVRSSTDTRQVNEAWRIVEKNNADRIYAIKGPPTDPDNKRTRLEFLCELGGES
jgi:head-tail adaptor